MRVGQRHALASGDLSMDIVDLARATPRREGYEPSAIAMVTAACCASDATLIVACAQPALAMSVCPFSQGATRAHLHYKNGEGAPRKKAAVWLPKIAAKQQGN
jgi:hypothetical protein